MCSNNRLGDVQEVEEFCIATKASLISAWSYAPPIACLGQGIGPPGSMSGATKVQESEAHPMKNFGHIAEQVAATIGRVKQLAMVVWLLLS